MSSPSPNPSSSFNPPKSILIVGSGVFGLSTAWSLAKRPEFSKTKITIVDRSSFPAPDGSSIDTSRIIRPDYADPAYAALAAKAHETWRQQGPDELGGSGRYSESGLTLVANRGSNGLPYVRSSYENVLALNKGTPNEGTVHELKSSEEIKNCVRTGGTNGNWGYINTRSGWADAEASMIWLRKQVEATKRVTFLIGTVCSLLYSSASSVEGVKLSDNTAIKADLTILATGAWTPTLVDLRGRCQATGQVLSYIDISDAEQAALAKMPVLLNMSSGMFVIPPANNILKVARHGYGYTNPTTMPCPSPNPSPADTTICCPRTALDDPTLWIPQEGEMACHRALREMEATGWNGRKDQKKIIQDSNSSDDINLY
ncbi:putative L-pipecolate oxidase [Glarea lozoyensis 74030]|uniref:Putative L-pipecolate oxidase n=1 Tax=Glarea lozoyensis (strain ATCC 74030 / MF5533) TaxID=1104152 RepID=H0EE88_GLAL7|nr:putative L-pipecolate oxidase [Glarea lozoyensis 74030]